MDANYIITRLKNTRYQFPTAQDLQKRVQNLDDFTKTQLLSNLKTELFREKNIDIYEPLCTVMQRRRSA